jgi:hypothetical protein
LSTNPSAAFGEARFAAYTGAYLDAYKRGYVEAGRFGNQGDDDWSDDERAAYRQGIADRYQDDQEERKNTPPMVDLD